MVSLQKGTGWPAKVLRNTAGRLHLKYIDVDCGGAENSLVHSSVHVSHSDTTLNDPTSTVEDSAVDLSQFDLDDKSITADICSSKADNNNLCKISQPPGRLLDRKKFPVPQATDDSFYAFCTDRRLRNVGFVHQSCDFR